MMRFHRVVSMLFRPRHGSVVVLRDQAFSRYLFESQAGRRLSPTLAMVGLLNYLSFFGGGREPGESFEAALERELREEAGAIGRVIYERATRLGVLHVRPAWFARGYQLGVFEAIAEDARELEHWSLEIERHPAPDARGTPTILPALTVSQQVARRRRIFYAGLEAAFMESWKGSGRR